jgi:dihydroorotate dehydrogenase
MPNESKPNPVQVPGLEINHVADGCIVYQPELDRVHYLNQTATVVLELCNGLNAEDELPELLRLAYDLPEAPVKEVADCLDTLRAQGVIV